MQALMCELCGGNELLKSDGLFVCTHCGTKYTVEEARNLVSQTVRVEGDVFVSGVASVDNLNRRAADFEKRGNVEEAYEYYNRVLDVDFDNEEAREGIARLDLVIDEPNVFVEMAADSQAIDVYVDDDYWGSASFGTPCALVLPLGRHEVTFGISGIKDRARKKRARVVDIESRHTQVRFRVAERKMVWNPEDALRIDMVEARENVPLSPPRR